MLKTYALTLHDTWMNILLRRAAENGNVKLIQYFLRKMDPWDAVSVILGYASGGHIELFHELYSASESPKFPNKDILVAAAFGDNVEIVEYLLRTGAKITADAVGAAAMSGHDAILRILVEKEKTHIEFALYTAKIYRQTKVVEYLSQLTKLSLSQEMCVYVYHNDINSLQKTRQKNGKFLIEMLVIAIILDYTDMFIYLVKSCYVYNEEILALATVTNRFDIVKFILENISVEHLHIAFEVACAHKYKKIRNYCLDKFMLFLEQELDHPLDIRQCIIKAANMDDLNIVKYLIKSKGFSDISSVYSETLPTFTVFRYLRVPS